MRKLSDLQRLYNESKQVLIQLGYEVEDVQVVLNSRFTRVLGRYSYREKKIEIGKKYFIHGNDEDIKNTIIHELLHQISGRVYQDYGHGKHWTRLAENVSARTPYKITRLASSDKFESIPNLRRERKYIVRCTHCGNEVKYATKSNAYKNPSAYYCGKCNERKTLVALPL